MKVKDLKPALVWEIFDAITQVPRPSKKEEKIRAYLLPPHTRNPMLPH